MKRIMVGFEVADKKWETMCDTLQNLLDNGNSELSVSEYETYEAEEQYPDIMKREKLSLKEKRENFTMKDINEMFDIFRVECRCVFNGGSKDDIVYEDNVIIINNYETAKNKFNYMKMKCNALGYYAHYDYYVRIRKCDIMDNGEPNCGEVVLEYHKGDK